MRVTCLFLIAAAFLAQSPLSAADGGKWWIVLQRDAAGNAHLAESSSLEWRSDGRVYFWSHLFFAYPQDGLKSALIEYSVHCLEGTIGEHRYIDYDANREEIERGDNGGEGSKRPREGSTGEGYVSFACSSDANRKKKFLLIESSVDRWTIGAFFSDPRPLTGGNE